MRIGRFLVTAVILWSTEGIAVASGDDLAAAPKESPTQDSPRTPELYWAEAKREIFAGIELTASQETKIEAIIEEAARDRARFTEVQKSLKQARQEGNTERAQVLSREVTEIRKTFRPSDRIDQMGAVLTDEQREPFERNRRLRGDSLLARRRAARETVPSQPNIDTEDPSVGGDPR